MATEIRYVNQVIAFAACVCLAAGCGAALPTLPSQGGAAWTEVQSAHFTVWTDAPAERGREIARELERRRQVVTTAMGGAARHTKAFVVALRSARELGMYMPWQFLGVAWSAATRENPTGLPGIVMNASHQERDHVLSHEVTHVIMDGIFGHQSSWLAEGMATYFETADIEVGDESARVGLPAPGRLRILRETLPLTIAQLFACHAHTCKDEMYYATSWALLSFLLNEHYDGLALYLQLAGAHPERAETTAWHDAFPELPLAQVDRELAEWLVTGRLRVPRIRLTLQDFPATAHALGDADVLAARSFLRMLFIARDEVVADEARAALALDRTNLLARLIETELTHAISADDARATAAAHPDDWRAWWLVELAHGGGAEVADAHRRLCALAENSAPRCSQAARDAVPHF